MGLLNKFFNSSSNVDKQLRDIYVPLLQAATGMPLSQAVSIFDGLLDQAKEEATAQGSSKSPPNLGDLLLERRATDENIRLMLEKKRREGVRDENIRWWWNMNDLERRVMLKTDDFFRLSMFIAYREKGMTEEQAAAKIGQFQPIFGDPDDQSHTSGDDRPLPYELKDRINIYIEKRRQLDPEQFKKEIEESLTFNALVRREIANGRI